MLKCSECERDIDIENKIYRCFDGTVCSNKCQKDRSLKILLNDKKMNNFSCWENKTTYLIDPNETTKQIQKTPSFVPIYVKSRSDLKKTVSKYNLHNFNEKEKIYEYEKNIDLNNVLDENIFLKKLGNISIFDSSYIDCSYTLLYSGARKLYNIINNMI